MFGAWKRSINFRAVRQILPLQKSFSLQNTTMELCELFQEPFELIPNEYGAYRRRSQPIIFDSSGSLNQFNLSQFAACTNADELYRSERTTMAGVVAIGFGVAAAAFFVSPQ